MRYDYWLDAELGDRVAGEQWAEDVIWIGAVLEERVKGARFTV